MTGPLDGSTVLHTAFYNDNYDNVWDDDVVFMQFGDEARAYPSGNYPAVTVSVVIGQERTDRAVSFPDGVDGWAPST